jgi:cytoskeletal protein CcmA (bactofilin family)
MNHSSERETVIESDAVLRGRVLGHDDVRVLGTVIGEVETDARVTVGTSGVVEGDIKAREIVVFGVVRGALSGLERIVLEEGARILGDLSTEQLILREGAAIRGRVRTDGGPVRHLAGVDEESRTELEERPPVPIPRPELSEVSSAPPAREKVGRPRRPRMRVKVKRRPVAPEVS